MPKFADAWLAVFALSLVVFTAAPFTRPVAAEEAAPIPVNNDPLVKVNEPESNLRLVEKFAKIVETHNRITTVYGFDPEVISVTKVDMHPNQIRVHALTPGVTSLVIVDEKNVSFTIEVFIIGDVRHLQAYIRNLFPNDAVSAIAVRDSVVLRGWVTRPEAIPRLMDIAKEFYPNVLNQLEVGGGQEIQLKVRVIEMQRSKIRQLGMNFTWLNRDGFFTSTPGSLTPLSGLTAPFGGPPGIEVAAKSLAATTITGGIVQDGQIFNVFLDSLKQEALLKLLADPILVTTNGQPANMLAGGEFPILVPQSLGTTTIEWKEFGVRLTAVPLLLGQGRVRLNLQPEVSERDFSNAVTTNGLTVPGLTTRRVNTSVEMRFGETFMLAGLISMRDTSQTFKVPFLGELPWIGAAFRRVKYDQAETELVILVTPVLAGPMADGQVPPGGPGMSSDTPTDRELYINGMIEVPNYGDRCEGCGNYPSSMTGFDQAGGGFAPLVTPVPVQELPPGPAGTAPAQKAQSSHLAPPDEGAAPANEAGSTTNGESSARLRRNSSIRQAGSQTYPSGTSTTRQADYTSAAGSNTAAARPAGRSFFSRPRPSTSNKTTTQSSPYGTYEPQSGLYVPGSPATR